MKYGIKVKKVDTYEILTRFEELAQSLNYLPLKRKDDTLKADLNSKNAFLLELQKMSSEFIEISKKTMDNSNDEEHAALNNLAKDKTIIITKADKGNAVVIQNVADFRKNIDLILSKDDKFKRLEKGDPPVRRENALHAPSSSRWESTQQ